MYIVSKMLKRVGKSASALLLLWSVCVACPMPDAFAQQNPYEESEAFRAILAVCFDGVNHIPNCEYDGKIWNWHEKTVGWNESGIFGYGSAVNGDRDSAEEEAKRLAFDDATETAYAELLALLQAEIGAYDWIFFIVGPLHRYNGLGITTGPTGYTVECEQDEISTFWTCNAVAHDLYHSDIGIGFILGGYAPFTQTIEHGQI